MRSQSHPERVRYYTGQFLQADDLNEDQSYHQQMRWRHNLALHSWGIVAGLDIKVQGRNVSVLNGMALDGYGRELVLAFPERHSMDGRSESDTWDVWLIYRSIEAKLESPQDACRRQGGKERIQERPKVQFSRRRELASPSPSKPKEVPEGDLDFGPNDPLPASDEQQWPVFLGKLSFRDGNWELDASERRYAGLVGEQVVGPKRSVKDKSIEEFPRTVIINGGVPESKFANHRFAVVERDDAGNEDTTWLAVRKTASKEQIEWNADRTIVAGDLTMLEGAALEFLPAPYSPDPVDPDDLNRWLMYHHFTPPKVPTEDDPPDLKETPFSDELRINIPTSSTGQNRFVIGTNPDGKGFVPILRISQNQTVEVYGELVVKGRLEGTPSVAPGSGPGGIPSFNTVLGYLKQHLDEADDDPDQSVVDLQKATIDKLVAGKDGDAHARATEFAEALTRFTAEDVTQPITTQVWNSENWRTSLGKTAPNVEGAFKEFLGALKPPSLGSAEPQLYVKFMGDWLFEQSDEGYGKLLARSIPELPSNGALVEFAKELNESEHIALLQSLLEAVLGEISQIGAKEVGIQFPSNLPLAKSFWEGLTISNGGAANDNGQRMVRVILKEKTETAWPLVVNIFTENPPTDWPPALDNIPENGPLRSFLKHVKDTNPQIDVGGTNQPFTEVVKLLGSEIDNL